MADLGKRPGGSNPLLPFLFWVKKKKKKESQREDSFSYHRGWPFSTPDEDNDFKSTGNCALEYHGGWWFKWCHKTFLNGPYIRGPNSYYGEGVIWEGFKGYHYSLKSSQMKIRLRDF